MTKLYYDDPLIAAYMSKEFGVEYITPEKYTYTHEWLDFFLDIDGDDIVDNGGEHYIHPDSHHIFEPQVGDLVYTGHHDGNEYTVRLMKFATEHKGAFIWSIAGAHGPVGKNCIKSIIQRNNKPFFNPLKEKESQ